jgi:Mor family transcriptional regulator
MNSQSKERKSILETAKKGGRTGDLSVGKSPMSKVTKNIYLSGYKGAAAQRLSTKLNMSLTSVHSDEKAESRAMISSPFKKPIL